MITWPWQWKKRALDAEIESGVWEAGFKQERKERRRLEERVIELTNEAVRLREQVRRMSQR